MLHNPANQIFLLEKSTSHQRATIRVNLFPSRESTTITAVVRSRRVAIPRRNCKLKRAIRSATLANGKSIMRVSLPPIKILVLPPPPFPPFDRRFFLILLCRWLAFSQSWLRKGLRGRFSDLFRFFAGFIFFFIFLFIFFFFCGEVLLSFFLAGVQRRLVCFLAAEEDC